MGELIKIREISSKYDISAHALKYYEDMGLISSTRSDDYAYRMYDAEAVTRIELILVLRKLNISIKDIQRIFATSGSETVLEVLGNKVSQFVPYNTHIHIIMEIHGVPILLNQDSSYDSSRRHNGGLWSYDNDEDLAKTINELSHTAIEVVMQSYEHWPICAFITDKYGVKWTLHNNK